MVYGSSNEFTYAMSGSAIQTAQQQPGPSGSPHIAPQGNSIYLNFRKNGGTIPFFFNNFRILPNEGQTASAHIYSGQLEYGSGSIRDITVSEADDMEHGRPVWFTLTPSSHSYYVDINALYLRINLYGSPSAIYFENQSGVDSRTQVVSASMLKPYAGSYSGYSYHGYYIWIPTYSGLSTSTTYNQAQNTNHTLNICTEPWAYVY